MTRGKRRKHAGRARSRAPIALPVSDSAPAVVSLRDAARYLGIHSSTLRRWIGSGKLSTMDGETTRVAMAEIVRLRALLEAETT